MAGLVMEEEPILSRLNRVEYIVKQLEGSPTLSSSSTNSSGVLSGLGNCEVQCRPVEEVLMEVRQKGTFMQRLIHAEDRIFKLCMQLEELGMGSERHQPKKGEDEDDEHPLASSKKGRMGLKKLVKSCVKFKKNHHHHHQKRDDDM